ncbi:MAG TPA: hypothetical protein VLT47_00270 [Anaeromyxobacteraceae bacterium]|nr:hypothetical protein [Anaeromyxobacteraceae bacterium]
MTPRPILLAALAVALPALAQELPPPPPPPSDDLPTEYGREPGYGGAATSPSEAPRHGRQEERGAPRSEPKVKHVKGTIGEGPVAPAGSQAASLHPDEETSHWRLALASGLVGRWGGDLVKPPDANSVAMLYLGAQADGVWSEGYGRGARLRLRMLTGGENVIFVPSDGDVEAAFMLGRREFRFVIGRLEATRSTALGIQTLLQAATVPSVEGSIPLADDTMRISYFVAPVEAAWDWYLGDNHIHRDAFTPPEQRTVYAATAARLRFTGVAPPSVLLSLQADFMKMWGVPDLLVSVEGSAGFAALENTVLFNVGLRWDHSTLRGPAQNSSHGYDQMLGMITASLLL